MFKMNDNEANEWMNEFIYIYTFVLLQIYWFVCLFRRWISTACLMMFVRLRHADNLWSEHAFHAKTGKGIPWQISEDGLIDW
jgi:hypothetical protein